MLKRNIKQGRGKSILMEEAEVLYVWAREDLSKMVTLELLPN